MEAIRASLESLLRRLPASAGQTAALMAWPLAAGETLAAHTRAEGLRAGTLIVAVADPAWARAMESMRSELLGRLAATLGRERVRAIEVRLREGRA